MRPTAPDLGGLWTNYERGVYKLDICSCVAYVVGIRALPMAKTLTIQDFFKRFPDDSACLAHLFQLRYGYDFGCPRCGMIGIFRKLSKQPAYTCNCGHHIHPMQGTIFQD